MQTADVDSHLFGQGVETVVGQEEGDGAAANQIKGDGAIATMGTAGQVEGRREKGGWTRSRHFNRRAWGILILVANIKTQLESVTTIKHDGV